MRPTWARRWGDGEAAEIRLGAVRARGGEADERNGGDLPGTRDEDRPVGRLPEPPGAREPSRAVERRGRDPGRLPGRRARALPRVPAPGDHGEARGDAGSGRQALQTLEQLTLTRPPRGRHIRWAGGVPASDHWGVRGPTD